MINIIDLRFYLRNDLFTNEELTEITKQITEENVFLYDIAEEKGCHPYTLNKCLQRFEHSSMEVGKFIGEMSELHKEGEIGEMSELHKEGALTTEELKLKFEIVKEILILIKRSEEAEKILHLLENEKVKTVAEKLYKSRSSVYDILKQMGFKKNKYINVWYHIDNENIAGNVENTKRDVELVHLYQQRYDNFLKNYYLDSEIIDIDKNILDDIETLSEEFEYETVNDFISVLLLRGLQNERFKNKENINNKNDNNNIVKMKDVEH
ncbi:hypothetical protein RHG52_19610, partial [Clostridioides difficile]|nr:hypothetical protein [Clostridioides difficile]